MIKNSITACGVDKMMYFIAVDSLNFLKKKKFEKY